MLRSLVGSEMCIRDRTTTGNGSIAFGLDPNTVQIDAGSNRTTNQPTYATLVADGSTMLIRPDADEAWRRWGLARDSATITNTNLRIFVQGNSARVTDGRPGWLVGYTELPPIPDGEVRITTNTGVIDTTFATASGAPGPAAGRSTPITIYSCLLYTSPSPRDS